MSKKILALLLAVVMVFGVFSPLAKAEENKTDATEATEVKTEAEENKEEAKEEEKTEEKTEETKETAEVDMKIKFLQDNGYIKGYEGGDLGLDKHITRAEFATIMVRANGQEQTAIAMKSVKGSFTDVSVANWANGYINVAKGNGVILGYPDGTFKPEQNINYAQIATMLDRVLGLVTPNEVYPTTYLTKAFAAGIFNGVTVNDYNEMATREHVFKMLYNTITSKEFGAHEIVKAIVLENSRVENMASDEVVIEVIDVVQAANNVDKNRRTSKKGDQYKYVIEKNVGDVENLLGKVVDFTITKDGKVINAKIDDSYRYVFGRINEATANKLMISGNVFTALQNERYRNSEDRIYRTYLNDKAYKYEDFSKLTEKKYDFARVTAKNGKVVFIDAYDFRDIAPVKETKKDGEDVYYYDDARDGVVSRISGLQSVILYNGSEFLRGSAKDIAGDDVIHVYGSNNKEVVVNKVAKFTGKLDKTYFSNRGEFVVSGDKELRLNKFDPFYPVYSYEGKTFRKLKNRGMLEAIRGREVKMLEGLDGSLQLIDSDLEWNDGVVGIRQILSNGKVKFIPATGDEFVKSEDFGTRYFTEYNEVSNRKLYRGFDKNDIVYLSSTEDNIRVMMKIFATTNGDNRNDAYIPAKINGRYITLTESKKERNYRYFSSLKAYYLDNDEIDNLKNANLQQVGDLGKFIRNNEKNTDLKAYVISDLELKTLLKKNLNIDSYYYLSNNSNIANTVVFVNVRGAKAQLEDSYVEVVRKYNYTTEMLFRRADGSMFTAFVANNAVKSTVEPGDIVLLGLDKATLDTDEMKGVIKERTIPFNQNTCVVKVNEEEPNHAIDADGKKLYTYQAVIFGDTREMYAQIDVDSDGFVNVMRYVDRPYGSSDKVDRDVVTVLFKGMDGNIQTKKDAGNFRIAPNAVLYYHNAKAADEKGEVIVVGRDAIYSYLTVGDDVKVIKTFANDAEEIILVKSKSQKDTEKAKEEAEKLEAAKKAWEEFAENHKDADKAIEVIVEKSADADAIKEAVAKKLNEMLDNDKIEITKDSVADGLTIKKDAQDANVTPTDFDEKPIKVIVTTEQAKFEAKVAEITAVEIAKDLKLTEDQSEAVKKAVEEELKELKDADGIVIKSVAKTAKDEEYTVTFSKATLDDADVTVTVTNATK